MARLLVVSRSMALAMRIADDHDVLEYPVEALEDLAPEPDVEAVVLDLGEPHAAMQTLDRLRSGGFDTRVLIVSGYQPAWNDLVSLSIDRVEVVPLPITRAALLDGIDRLLGVTPFVPRCRRPRRHRPALRVRPRLPADPPQPCRCARSPVHDPAPGRHIRGARSLPRPRPLPRLPRPTATGRAPEGDRRTARAGRAPRSRAERLPPGRPAECAGRASPAGSPPPRRDPRAPGRRGHPSTQAPRRAGPRRPRIHAVTTRATSSARSSSPGRRQARPDRCPRGILGPRPRRPLPHRRARRRPCRRQCRRPGRRPAPGRRRGRGCGRHHPPRRFPPHRPPPRRRPPLRNGPPAPPAAAAGAVPVTRVPSTLASPRQRDSRPRPPRHAWTP